MTITCGINTVSLAWVIMFMFVVDDVLSQLNSIHGEKDLNLSFLQVRIVIMFISILI